MRAMDTRADRYTLRRAEIETYFDRTAAQAWARMTSDAPLSRIRQTVRAGRERMRAQLLSWLPDDLRGARVLDAGCGTGLASVELAARGADVVAVDLSPTLVDLAAQRLPADLGPGRVRFIAGDMLDDALGAFDHVFAMDSLIHYDVPEAVAALSRLAPRVRRSIVFTFAPRTPALAAMHAVGRLFPRGERAPAIVPVAQERLTAQLRARPEMHSWHAHASERVAVGFYTSQGACWVRAADGPSDLPGTATAGGAA
jgi:magnesium-protoporphyrin O-methyltransferase